MTEIIDSADCGNSPKNRFVQDIAIALETGAEQGDQFDENVAWARTPDEQITGRDALVAVVAAKQSPAKVIVEHAISHGKVGAANGEVILPNGQSYRFCHVIAFSSVKANCVTTIASYG